MIEGLIDFSDKFCLSPLESVVMNNVTWGFYNCESDVWFISGMDNLVSRELISEGGIAKIPTHLVSKGLSPSGSNFHLHRPNIHGISASLRNIYASFHLFNGPVSTLFQNCWSTVSTVANIRKAVRKLRLILAQKKQDLCSVVSANGIANDDDCNQTKINYQSYDVLKEQVASIEADIEHQCGKLHSILQPSELSGIAYEPRLIREKISRHMRFCMQSGELLSPSALHDMQGFISCAETAAHWPSPSFLTSELLGVRSTIQNSFCGHCVGFYAPGRFPLHTIPYTLPIATHTPPHHTLYPTPYHTTPHFISHT